MCKQSRQWRHDNEGQYKQSQKIRWQANKKHFAECGLRWKRAQGVKPMSENKECSLYFGVCVAERVLSHVFNDIEQMPNCNPGFDFICNRGKKIDVKSSCTRYAPDRAPYWQFHINRNVIADYFLCLAFDNRNDLNPIYVWLVPGSTINHLIIKAISESTIWGWDEYVISLDKIISCCDAMKTGQTI